MQRVNFYFSEYHPKPLSFDSRFAGLILAIVLISLLLWGLVKSNQLKQSQQALNLKKQHVSQLESNILLAQKELAHKLNHQELPEKITSAQQELNDYKKLTLVINQPIQPPAMKYSDILKDLSKSTIDSVWLTEINIQSQSLSLSGATTNKTFIPDYVSRLNQSTSLKRQFDELQIERGHSNDRIVSFKLLKGKLINE